MTRVSLREKISELPDASSECLITRKEYLKKIKSALLVPSHNMYESY